MTLMRVGKFGLWGSWVVLGLACLSCDDDDDDGPRQSTACDVAGRETDLCRIWVRREIACGTATQSEEELLARCRSDWTEYPSRVAPCFVAELGECLGAACEDDEDGCYMDALVANDPSVVDSSRYEACRTTEQATGCDDLPRGYLKECISRAQECKAFDDLCASTVALREPYRADAEACIARSCDDFEGCLYAAMGRTPPE